MLRQVMCAHDAEKLAVVVLEIYDGGHVKSEVQSYEIPLRDKPTHKSSLSGRQKGRCKSPNR
jgi:hypothetical protein